MVFLGKKCSVSVKNRACVSINYFSLLSFGRELGSKIDRKPRHDELFVAPRTLSTMLDDELTDLANSKFH